MNSQTDVNLSEEHVYDNPNTKTTNLITQVEDKLNEMNMNDPSLQQAIQAQQASGPTPVLSFLVEIDDTIKKKIDEKLRECGSGDSDSDSDVNIYTPKAVDLPSAQRLAKRLYYLDGFKANDVVRHLSKK